MAFKKFMFMLRKFHLFNNDILVYSELGGPEKTDVNKKEKVNDARHLKNIKSNLKYYISKLRLEEH